MTRALLALGLWAAFAAGAADGRRGNDALAGGALDAATEAYVAGLARDGVPPAIGARLWHNLGLVRLAARQPAPADSAFAEALALAPDAETRAAVAFSLGTAALAAGDAERAVAALRRALVLRPDWPEARRNLALALRLRDDGPPPPPEPSDFAVELKARADSLVAARRYRSALDLMEDGLARDSTVAAFQDFIGRLGGVVQIEEAPADTAAAPRPTP